MSCTWLTVRQSPPTSDSDLIATTIASEAIWNWTTSRPTLRQASHSARLIVRAESTRSILPWQSSWKAWSSPLLRTRTCVTFSTASNRLASRAVSEPRVEPSMSTIPDGRDGQGGVGLGDPLLRLHLLAVVLRLLPADDVTGVLGPVGAGRQDRGRREGEGERELPHHWFTASVDAVGEEVGSSSSSTTSSCCG